MSLSPNTNDSSSFTLNYLQSIIKNHKQKHESEYHPLNLNLQNNEEITIKSPFYTKHDSSKGPCECIYHRMKRFEEKKTVQKSSLNPYMKNLYDTYRRRIAEAVRKTKRNRSIFEESSILSKERSARKSINSRKTIVEKEQKKYRFPKLDSFNEQYHKLLKKRIDKSQQKTKEIEFFHFYKEKITKDPFFHKEIKPFIMNYFNQITNKFSLKTLLEIDFENEQSDNILKKIGNIMNCKKKKAIQKFIEEIKQIKKIMENEKTIADEDKTLKQPQKKESQLKINIEKTEKNIKEIEKQTQIQIQRQIQKQSEKKIVEKKQIKIEEPLKQIVITNTENTSKKIKKDSQILISQESEGVKDKKESQISKRVSGYQSNTSFKGQNSQKREIIVAEKVKKMKTHEKGFEFKKNSAVIRQSVLMNSKMIEKISIDEKGDESKIQMSKQNLEIPENEETLSLKKSASVKKRNTQKHTEGKRSRRIAVSIREKEKQKQKERQKEKQKQKEIEFIKEVSERKRRPGKKQSKESLYDKINYKPYCGKESFFAVKKILLQKKMSNKEKVTKLFSIIRKDIFIKKQTEGRKFFQDFDTLLTPDLKKEIENKISQIKEKSLIDNLTKQADKYINQISTYVKYDESADKIENTKKQKQTPSINLIMNLDYGQQNSPKEKQEKASFFNVLNFQEKQTKDEIQEYEGTFSQRELGGMIALEIDKENLPKVRKIETRQQDRNDRKSRSFEEMNEMLMSKCELNREKNIKALRYMKNVHPSLFKELKYYSSLTSPLNKL